jgi:hypothetical protein
MESSCQTTKDQLFGSPSLCGLVVAEKRKEPSAKEFGSCTAVHSAFQGLEPVDLTLGLTIAPAFGDGILDGSEVMPDGVRKPAHAVQTGAVSVVEPGV